MSSMRSWLRDDRAYRLMRRWARSAMCKPVAGYNQVENFRAWACRSVNRFFDITNVWREQDLRQCYRKLWMEPPSDCWNEHTCAGDTPSEDEIICARMPEHEAF